MLLNLTEYSTEPLYDQITRQLMDKIIEGDIRDGEALEPINNFARSQHVSISTAKRAYEHLAREGLIQSKGDGNYSVAFLSAEKKREIAVQKVLEENVSRSELEMAREIQANLLPDVLPDEEYLSIAAISSPSSAVGGDFYDYIPLSGKRHGLIIADACGKGLPAAMLISQIQAMLKSELNNGSTLQKTLMNLNDQIARFTPKDKFITLFFGIYNEASGRLEYANAGHNFPIIVRANGVTEYLGKGGPALGIASDVAYTLDSIYLGVDDVVLLYTDGITETMNYAKEEYGEKRLLEMLRGNRFNSVHRILDAILDDVHAFENNETQHDDRTMLILKI